jgi:very-short-patch-repair endonuclease
MVYSKIINNSKQSHDANLSTKSKARDLRKSMTNAENILWDNIRRRKIKGMYFRRQHPYGMYIMDFYCDKANLAIEIDGDIHQYKKTYDKERTKYLESTGITVLRFSNEDVEKRLDKVLDKICDCLPDKNK